MPTQITRYHQTPEFVAAFSVMAIYARAALFSRYHHHACRAAREKEEKTEY